MTDKKPIVVMKGITIEFPGVKALDGVDLTLYPGEVHALMGENGAGKSTMIKALTGVYKINAGTIMVEGKPQTFNGTLDAQNAGIATVYQEVNLCTNLSIGENVMLGHEVRGPLGINWKKTHAEARKYLAQMGLDHLDSYAPLNSISIAMQQLVAIARAMVIDAKVLILDDSTSAVDTGTDARIRRAFASRMPGVTKIIIAQRLSSVEDADMIVVLDGGRINGVGTHAELLASNEIYRSIHELQTRGGGDFDEDGFDRLAPDGVDGETPAAQERTEEGEVR